MTLERGPHHARVGGIACASDSDDDDDLEGIPLLPAGAGAGKKAEEENTSSALPASESRSPGLDVLWVGAAALAHLMLGLLPVASRYLQVAPAIPFPGLRLLAIVGAVALAALAGAHLGHAYGERLHERGRGGQWVQQAMIG